MKDLSSGAEMAWRLSAHEAAAVPNSTLITTLHLTSATAGNPGDIAGAIFSDLGVDSKVRRNA